MDEGWDQLAHPNFWRGIMTLAPDSCIVNIAKTREIIAVMSNADWNAQTDTQKDAYRDSVRTAHSLTREDRIFVTTGKNDFYKFDEVYTELSCTVEESERNDVDPCNLQAIL